MIALTSQYIVDGVALHHGDCLDVLAALPENSVEAVVCDPPYGLGFMGKHWDHAENVAFRPETWAAVLRVLKPGGHIVAFSGTRTYHRMVVAIEDAGFEVRDQLAWVYGSGFPKSLDVSKALDKAAGAEREVIATVRVKGGGTEYLNRANAARHDYRPDGYQKGENVLDVTAPATDAARQWEGWGTALKPAWESICLARKPLSEKTVAANVLRWGVGALNIDATRIKTVENLNGGAYAKTGGRKESQSLHGGTGMNVVGKTTGKEFEQPPGRWPANLTHDGSDDVLAGFPESNGSGPARRLNRGERAEGDGWGMQDAPGDLRDAGSGSAARFFYCAKANKTDRAGSKHPTVKPVSLMRWLVRMVTPPGGTVLDPFAGTGTTGQAAIEEGFSAILIEREDEYVADIRERIGRAEKQKALL